MPSINQEKLIWNDLQEKIYALELAMNSFLQTFATQETFPCLINKYLSPRYIPGKTSSYGLICPPVDGARELFPLFCEFGSNTYCLAHFCRFTILYVIKIHQPVKKNKLLH